MIYWLKQISRRVTPAEVAARELAETELRLLEARTAKEFADSVIAEHETRVKRLRKFLAELEKHSEPV